jgi:hypothetical protein
VEQRREWEDRGEADKIRKQAKAKHNYKYFFTFRISPSDVLIISSIA